MSFYVGIDLGQAADYTAISVIEKEMIPTGRVIVNHRVYEPGEPRRHNPADQRYHEEEPEMKPHYLLRHLERPELGTPYPAIVQRVKDLVHRPELPKVSAIVIDATGVGRAVVDMFYEARLRYNLEPVNITPGNSVTTPVGSRDTWGVPKRDLVSTLQVLIQNRDLLMPPEKDMPLGAILKAEMLNFKAKISQSGHDSYGAGGASDWREGQHDDLLLSVSLACWYAEYQQDHRPMIWSL
jgi:hypothetical protein